MRCDIIKPLVRWTNVNIGGTTCKVLFRFEKLADFCYVCGSLTHLEKHCPIAHPNGLRFYGTWLRANGNNPITILDISTELNRMNAKKSSPPSHSASPRTPNTRDLFTPSPSIPALSTSKFTNRANSQIYINSILQASPNSSNAPTLSCPPGFENMIQKQTTTKTNTGFILGDNNTLAVTTTAINSNTEEIQREVTANDGKNAVSNGITKDLFDATFLQNFSFAPTITFNTLTDNLNCYNKPNPREDPLIPTEQILSYFNSLESSKHISGTQGEHSTASSSNMNVKDYKGKAKVETGMGKLTALFPKKRFLTPPKARTDPAKKTKKEAIAVADNTSPTLESVVEVDKAEDGPSQPRPSP